MKEKINSDDNNKSDSQIHLFKFPKSVKRLAYFAIGLIGFNTAINTLELVIHPSIKENEVIELHFDEMHPKVESGNIYVTAGGDSFLLQKIKTRLTKHDTIILH